MVNGFATGALPEQIDNEAALRLIAADPHLYPVIRDLPDDLKAVYEPSERSRRYEEVLALLLAETEDAAFRLIPGDGTPKQRQRLRRLFHASKVAGRMLADQRTSAWRDKRIVCEANQQLRDAVANLKCELQAERDNAPAGAGGGR